MLQNTHVAAGIITYNPEGKRLSENISAIASQVECIYIYDNNSSNRNKFQCLLSDYNKQIEYIHADKNNGVSVALNAIAHRAVSDGYEAVLLLDQDSVVSEGVVSTLTSILRDDIGIVAANPIDRNTLSFKDIGETEIDVDRAITSGSLLNLNAYQAVGGYDERLFVDWVDYEFCDNLRLHGWRIVQSGRATILHECAHQEVLRIGFLKRESGGNGWRIQHFRRMNWSKSRFKDQIRSRLITVNKYKGTDIGKKEKHDLIQNMFMYLITEKGKISLLQAYYHGILDAKKLISKKN